ncbi:MAG: sulfatase [Patescibacteria group bacterium]
MQKFAKNILLPLVLVSLLIYILQQYDESSRGYCRNCNVILIDIDSLRADGLPCSGYSRNTTPNICSLASKSSIFRKNISQYFYTLPSMYSTITGLYPGAHHVFNSYADALNPQILTMAQYLKDFGYKTCYAGLSDYTTLSKESGGLRGFDCVLSQIEQVSGWRSVIESLSKEKKPFFVHFYVNDLHMPYTLPANIEPLWRVEKPKGFPVTWEEFESSLADYLSWNYSWIFTDSAIKKHPDLFFSNDPDRKDKLLKYFNFDLYPEDEARLKQSWIPIYNSYTRYVNIKNPDSVLFLRTLYDTKLALLDRDLGDFFDFLRVSKLLKNTVIVIASSHGEEFGEHGSFAHQNLFYQELINTPLIIYNPKIKDNRFITSITRNIDILPTVIEILGQKVTGKIQGKSLLSIMLGKSETNIKYAVSGDLRVGERGASIQDERWKLIVPYSKEKDLELYDLLLDPREQNNAALTFPEKAKEMLSPLKEILKESDGLFERVPLVVPKWIDKETKERLIRQGYF